MFPATEETVMALQILNTGGPDPEVVVGQIQAAIENALPGAAVDVRCVSPGHFEIKVTSEASMATSVPVPMAIPTSAWANAGASLMPSPTMPTKWPSSCSRWM